MATVIKAASNSKQKYVPPKTPSGFSFVLANSIYKRYAGWCVYVKYKSADKYKITIKQLTKDFIWLICPDRELVIVRNAHETGAFVPYGEGFDEVHDFNLFNDAISKELEIDYIMTNYAHATEKEMSPRLKTDLSPNKRIHVLSDSGGLQVVRGVSDLINPIELVEFYNNNVDAGMVLDLPLAGSSSGLAKKNANIQRMSNDLMLKYSKGVELINICHGVSLEERNTFRSIVEDKKIPRMAFAGLYRFSELTIMDTMLDTITTGQKYKQYHALGIFTSHYIALFVKMANTGLMPHITSDSTSHLQSGRTKAFHFHMDPLHTPKNIPIGYRATVFNARKIIPCQCAVCSPLKYMDIFSAIPDRWVLELLSLHNALSMLKYIHQLQEIAIHNPKEYNSIVARQFAKHPMAKEIKMCLDYIDVTAQYGLKAARKKYSSFLGVLKRQPSQVSNTLFGKQESELDIRTKNVTELMNKAEKLVKSLT